MVLLKSSDSYLTNEDVANLSKVNSLYQEIVHNVVEFRTLSFSKLWEPRIGYADQIKIQSFHVNMAATCAIFYLLHPGMIIRYLKGEYAGKNRNDAQILHDVSSCVIKMTPLTSNKFSLKAAPWKSALKNCRQWKHWLFVKATKQCSRCIRRSLLKQWTERIGIATSF